MALSDGSGILKRLSGVQLSAERLRYLTNEQGTSLAQRQQAHAHQVLADAINPALIRRARAEPHPAAPSERPTWLQVGLDGGWVSSREQPGGMEGKIGVVASQSEPVGKHGRHRLRRRKYVATFGPAEEVRVLAYAAAWELEPLRPSSRSSWAMEPTGSKPRLRNTFPRR